MHTNNQLCEIDDLLRYSTKLPVKKSVIYKILRFHLALNCFHYKRIMIQRLRQYLDKYAFMQRATMLVKFPNFVGYRLCCFRIFAAYSMEVRNLVLYFFVLGNPIFLHFRPILINLIKVVSPRVEMCIKR
ncbi:hypothetical protein T10_11053 [Trichinella papuae]|uniref:Uncharacterized protein n=1 Tax=Trichinella papuae TaxID=268474 RepID=A0A0V1MME2_9BILA|nr:hypothetical protein T10_11053 [Trichinella papuae]